MEIGVNPVAINLVERIHLSDINEYLQHVAQTRKKNARSVFCIHGDYIYILKKNIPHFYSCLKHNFKNF